MNLTSYRESSRVFAVVATQRFCIGRARRGNSRAHVAYESKVGPYHGTSRASQARATLSRTTSLLTTNTASNRCATLATHALTSGRPRDVSTRVTDPPASTRSTRSAPMAARWHRPIHRHSKRTADLPSRYGSTGPIPPRSLP